MQLQRLILSPRMLLVATALSVACSESVSPPVTPLSLATTGAPGGGITLDQWNGTLSQNGTMIIKGFNPTSPQVGDAIVATFFWLGSSNTIDSVTDVLTTSPYTPVGNKYELVEYVTAGGISMATYVAINVQNFPSGYNDPSQEQILAVRANFSVPVVDGGVLLSAWKGVSFVSAQALGAHRSASGSGMGPTVAAPGSFAVNAGALVYGVTLSNGLAGLTTPTGFTNIATMSDLFMKSDGEYDAQYTVSPTGGTANPEWTWHYTLPGSWLATGLSLNAAPTTGSLTVGTTTTGSDVPATGYTLTVDGNSQTIGPNASVTINDLAAGDHALALSGIPSNCTPSETNPTSASVPAGGTVTVTFSVSCASQPPQPPQPPPPPPSAASDDFMTGGGKVREGRDFATFGLVARPTGGEFEWVQHCPNGAEASDVCGSGKFSFHGEVTSGTYGAGSGERCRTWSGTGYSKQKGALPFTVAVGCDQGEPGRGVDYIEVRIGDYRNGGYLAGGNIQLHKSKSGGAAS